METIKFLVNVGEDQIIRPPDGISIPRGHVEVTIKQVVPPGPPSEESLARTRAWLLGLAAKAEALMPDSPEDLAEHHDHYAHGKPLP
jgi:hypothetical protein